MRQLKHTVRRMLPLLHASKYKQLTHLGQFGIQLFLQFSRRRNVLVKGRLQSQQLGLALGHCGAVRHDARWMDGWMDAAMEIIAVSHLSRKQAKASKQAEARWTLLLERSVD